MNDQSLESEVREYYSAARLDEDRVQALLGAADLARSASRWKRTAVAACIGMAATTLLSVSLYFYPRDRNDSATKMANRVANDSIEHVEHNADVAVPSVPETHNGFRLVAFRSHGDRCPHCRATGDVYADLAKTLRDDAIPMEQFDLSRFGDRAQVNQRIKELRLTKLIEGRSETAFLALVDRQGQSIQEYKPSMRADKIAASVREKLASRGL